MDDTALICHLRESGEYSDLTVKCGPKVFKVHKNIVCPRSGWFAAACQEGKWDEGQTGIVELAAMDDEDDEIGFSLDDPAAVELMIDYIYYGGYLEQAVRPKPIKGTEAGSKRKRAGSRGDFDDVSEYLTSLELGQAPLTLHTRVYALAIKYDVANLKEAASSLASRKSRNFFQRVCEQGCSTGRNPQQRGHQRM